MSERWVSIGKYWCSYCKCFVTDNKISRLNHEQNQRHKSAVKHFVQDIHRKGAQKSKEEEKTRRLLAQVEAAAGSQFAHDVASGSASASSSMPTSIITKETPKASFYKEKPNPKPVSVVKKEPVNMNSAPGPWMPVESKKALPDEDEEQAGLEASQVSLFKIKEKQAILEEEEESATMTIKKRKLNQGNVRKKDLL